jgi:hypothetical protein
MFNGQRKPVLFTYRLCSLDLLPTKHEANKNMEINGATPDAQLARGSTLIISVPPPSLCHERINTMDVDVDLQQLPARSRFSG